MQKNTTYIEILEEKESNLNQFIRGSLLGDGCIPKIGVGGKNYRLVLTHGPKQLNYLKWKHAFLEDFYLSGKLTSYTAKSERYKNGECVSYFVKSKTHPIFTKFRNLYYPEGKKILNKEDIEHLNEFGLAIWFMDDGYVNRPKLKSPFLIFATTGFSTEDVLFLIDLLWRKWEIKATHLINDNEIRISTYSTDKLIELIKPYIVKELEYKMVHLKLGEFGEHLEADNTEPSINLND